MFVCEGGRCEKISEANYRQEGLLLLLLDTWIEEIIDVMAKKTSAFKQ